MPNLDSQTISTLFDITIIRNLTNNNNNYTSNSDDYHDNIMNLNQLMETKDNIEDMQTYLLNQLNHTFNKNIQTVTLIITSCGRLDLLNVTITSFLNNLNTNSQKYQLIDKYIVDDCCLSKYEYPQCLELLKRYGDIFNIIFTKGNNEKTRELSIVHNLDIMNSAVKSDWIYHMEDDWETTNITYDDDIIEYSLKVYESNFIHYQNPNYINPNIEWFNTKRDKIHQDNVLYSKVACSDLHFNEGRDQLLNSSVYQGILYISIIFSLIGNKNKKYVIRN